MLLEKIEVLVVGAKPVKKPIEKQRKKWRVALFHDCTFFFDLSKDPIAPNTPKSMNNPAFKARHLQLRRDSFGQTLDRRRILRKMGFYGNQRQGWKRIIGFLEMAGLSLLLIIYGGKKE